MKQPQGMCRLDIKGKFLHGKSPGHLNKLPGAGLDSQSLELSTKFMDVALEHRSFVVALAERSDSVTGKPSQIPPGAAFPGGSEPLAGFWGGFLTQQTLVVTLGSALSPSIRHCSSGAR